MNWKIWDRTGNARELTLSLKLALSNQHQSMGRNDVEALRFVDQRAPSGGEKGTLFRIFDPRKLEGNGAAKVTFEGLDSQRKAMCFEGTIDAFKVIGRMRDVRV